MKLRFNHNTLLACCVLALAVACFLSVNAPIRFEHEQQTREAVVKRRLVAIRRAQVRYCKVHGFYADRFDRLVREGLLTDSQTTIPFSDGRRFALAVSVKEGRNGRQIPLMECGAAYQDYLHGLNENSIANLIDRANAAGRYPGLKIGDITTENNNAGNWE